MLANRFTVFIDACVLAGALKRNILLSLAEADFFRPRWSNDVLEETERAICQIIAEKGDDDALPKSRKARAAIERAFPDAAVSGYDRLIEGVQGLPDPNDRHVVAAALMTRAYVIVTDNVKDFPAAAIAPLSLEAKTADEFIADTIHLNPAGAVVAIRRLRQRLKNPEMTPELLLLKMETNGLIQTADVLREHLQSL